jgi:unspecific monooxygenase
MLAEAGANGEKLTEDELVSTAILLLNAGHEATVHQTGNAVKTILQSGQNIRELFADVKAAEDTVEETLRFDAPLHMFTRYVYRTTEIADGITVKPGDQVALLLGAANRDPASYYRAGEFLPGRSDQKNVTFGAGIHFCIGAPLARLEMQVSLKVLFDRLPNIKLTEPPLYRDSYHFHGLETLNVAW